jgi:hypothetical protein
MTPTIAEMVARYDMADGQFITLRHRDGKVHITAANMMVETGDEVKAIIADFLSRATTPGNCSKISKNRSEINENRSKINENRSKISEKPKSLRKRPSIFTDEQKADIIRRYKAGEGPKAISESLGCSRSLITHIIRDAGVVEGRTGAHLNRKKEEPQPEADENEPV